MPLLSSETPHEFLVYFTVVHMTSEMSHLQCNAWQNCRQFCNCRNCLLSTDTTLGSVTTHLHGLAK
jgi:hypothetical protein